MTHTEKLVNLKDDFLFSLNNNNKLKAENVAEIELNDPPVYQYVDEQCNQVITRINTQRQEFEIDDGLNSNEWWRPIELLDIYQLAYILDEIEDGNYEVIEEYGAEGDL